ncbi:MAG: hypothetical protein ACOC1U_08180 [Spirochaetota bacterium]
MHSRIPLLHRLRHLAVFSRLLLAYNVGLSAIGASALIALSLAGLLGAPDAMETARETVTPGVSVTPDVSATPGVSVTPGAFPGFAWWDEVCTGVLVTGLLIVSVGHWLAVLVVHLAHHREYALYRSGGWGATGLWFASWSVSVLVGVVVFGIGALAC